MHPYFRILMVAVIVASLLVSCEYGPKHGKVPLSQNPFSSEFDGQGFASSAANAGDGRSEDDFTASDIRYKDQIVTLSHEGRCWAICLDVDAFELQEVLDLEDVNHGESSDLVSSGECPRVAFDGMTRDKQEIRVILTDCEEDPKIVEIIDLKEQKECDCE